MNVLIVNPGDQRQVYQDLADEWTAIEPPIWGRLLISYLERKGIHADILDAEAEGLTVGQTTLRAGEMRPSLCVVVAHGHQPSASTQKMPSVIATCRDLKELYPDLPLIVVGGHPAALPERTLEETGADFVCTGEGPTAILGILRVIKNGGLWDSVPGICFVDGPGKGFYRSKAGPAPNVQDLDGEMPGGQWDKLLMGKYRAHNWHCFGEESRKPYASIYTSLNCPYECSFCMIASPFREGDKVHLGKSGANLYRTWSAQSVINEIETLVERHDVTNIKIADEMYILQERHVNTISDAIIERGWGDRLNIWCYGRVDQTKEKFLEKLRRSGVRWIALGIEALSDEVRDGVDKADYGYEDIVRTVERIRSHGINVMGNYLFGLPQDTAETMEQTLRLALELKTEFANFYSVVTYPGSILYDEKVSRGWRPPPWGAYSFHAYDHEPVGTETLSPTEVLRFRDEAFRRYFTDPGYLAMIRAKFGERAEGEIKKMTGIRLRRKLLGD